MQVRLSLFVCRFTNFYGKRSDTDQRVNKIMKSFSEKQISEPTKRYTLKNHIVFPCFLGEGKKRHQEASQMI